MTNWQKSFLLFSSYFLLKHGHFPDENIYIEVKKFQDPDKKSKTFLDLWE
jgi:hypothetical protein